MCGIAGYVALDGHPVQEEPIVAMLDLLRHRGPDDSGTFLGPGVALGNRRLSVIDVAGGHQPMRGDRSTTMLVLNGEIYNYRELARELEAHGDSLRTKSDTEVAARAYDRWGLDFLDRLDGMFALALWDGEARRLVLARDRLGEKPLYYAVADGLVIFASELSAMLSHPAVPRELDPASLSTYLALEYLPAPASIIRGVEKLEPGSVLVVQSGQVRMNRYWRIDPRPAESPPAYRDAVDRLRHLLEDAVRTRLVSDVPLGVFLSGGVDSSTVAAFAARHTELDTFTVGFEEASFDERRHAKGVATHIGGTHHELVLTGKEMSDLAPSLGRLLDEPLGDASVVPTVLLSEFARRNVTVALGGDGGDELFAGYPMHQAHRVAPHIRRLPAAVRRSLTAAALRLPVSHRNFSLGFKATTFLRGAGAAPPLNHALWMSSYAPREQEGLLTRDVWEAAGRGTAAFGPLTRIWEESEGAPLGARARHLDALTYLPGDILTKVDRASMSVSLEVRAPFLSRAVTEFAFSLPDSYHMRRLNGKRLLKDAVADLLPPQVLRRPKKGFGIPVARWLNGPLTELTDDLLNPEALAGPGLFDPLEVRRRLDEHRSGVRDHRKPLWTLLVFEMWRRAHLTDGS